MQVWLPLLLFSAALAASATAGPVVPLTSRRTADFVPAGWRIEKRFGGDLNADQRPDSVLALIETKERLNDNNRRSQRRALLVLLAQPGRVWHRVGYTNRLLYCTGCFVHATSPEESTPQVELSRRGVLAVRVGNGTSNIWTSTVAKFRFESGSGRMRLIGEDVDHKNGTYDGQQISTNLLTSRQKLTLTQYWTMTDEPDSRPRVTTRWHAIRPLKAYLEDYREGETLRHELN